MKQVQYHLATFDKPVTISATLPAHIVEQPAELQAYTQQQYENLAQFVRSTNTETLQGVKTRNHRDVSGDNKPILVYEESTNDEPQKFYGKKDEFQSATGDVPNYAFLIYDVSFLTLTSVEKKKWIPYSPDTNPLHV